MNANLEALRLACARKGAGFWVHHASQNLAEVEFAGRRWLFVNQTPPLNAHAMGLLCRDKDFFQTLAQGVVRMPRMEAFLNPQRPAKYQKYFKHDSIETIMRLIGERFEFPCVVKRNRGAVGSNVFKCGSPEEVRAALTKIFDPDSKNFDYVALCQEYVRTKKEYRCVFLDGRMELCYQKDNTGSGFMGNLSPLHFDGARAVLETDEGVLERIRGFCAPLFGRMELRYCGLDVLMDHDGGLWLLEANGSPGFEYFVRDCGIGALVDFYEKVLVALGSA